MQEMDTGQNVVQLKIPNKEPKDPTSHSNGLPSKHTHVIHSAIQETKKITSASLKTFSTHAFLQGMACMAEYYEPYIAQHLSRIHAFLKVLMRQLEGHPKFVELLSKENQLLIADAALLHDIGKVNIPTELRSKPGIFSSIEFEMIAQHTYWGKEIIEENRLNLPLSRELAVFAQDIAYSHHERWDGSGYPQQLMAEQIPVVGRLMAIVDVYDGLISPRTYKSALSHQDAMEIIRADRKILFDPDIQEAFIATAAQIQAIAMKYPILSDD